jgi:hypothetical protein
LLGLPQELGEWFNQPFIGMHWHIRLIFRGIEIFREHYINDGLYFMGYISQH